MLCGSMSYAQDFSNKGKEFWLAYCYHVGMVNGGGAPVMTLYLTSDVATTYTVEIYGVTTIATGAIAANQVIPVVIPNTYFINTDGTSNNKTIRVTAIKPIVVYSFITRSAASAATLCLPTNVLGKEYYALSYTQISNEANASSFITIIAVEDNTSVDITPTAATVGGWAANSTNTITLNKGQIYQVLGTTTGTNGVDLSGTKVKSVASASGSCKRIAVFSGSGKLSIASPTLCTQTSADNLYQQLYPVASWGKKFLTAPSSARPNNFYRIMRSDPLSNVYLNGVLIPAASFINNYYQFYNNTPNLIESDIPITVAQYFTTQNCPSGAGGNPSPYDPDMIVLNPVEQNISKVTLVNSPLTATGTHIHNLHVILKNSGTALSSFRFDGAAVAAASWVLHPQDINYSYLYLSNITAGNHTLASDSGFNALAYGYANAETYGYSAGANIKDLYQYVSVQNQYATVNFPATCRNTPFYFKMTFPYQPTNIDWDLGILGTFSMPNPSLYSIGVIVVGGKTLYQYQIPAPYSIATAGTYPIKVTAANPTPDGCSGTQEIEYDLQVYNNPVADFNFSNVCFPNPVLLTDNSNTDSRPIITRYWSFGDASTGSTNNPSHAYTAPGSYTVRYSLITDIGCIADTIQHIVTVSPLPTASIAGAVQVCVNDPSPNVTFTGAVGAAPYTFTYNINGGANQTVVTTSGNSVTVAAPTTVAGTFTYNLVSVKDASPALCSQNQTGSVVVQVNTLPTASIAGAITVCKNATSPNITFTGASGAPPYTFTYNINGGASQTITTTSGNSVTVAAPTTTAGTFTYNLISVQGGISNSCSQPQTGNTIVIINPDAAISLSTGSNTQSVCINTPITNITYTISDGGTGGTVTGLPTGVTGFFNSGVFTISGTPTVVGTYNYTVNTTGICLQTSATGTITINPDATLSLSSAAPTANQAVCESVAIANITYGIGGGGTGGTVTGLPPGVTGIYGGGVFTISGSPTVVGTYNYTVNTTGTCLQQNANGTITVNPDAVISLTSAANTNAQVLCINSTLTPISYSIGGGGTGGTVTGLPSGVTGSYSGGVFTITGIPTTSGTFNYTVNTTGTCIQKTAMGIITIDALPTPNFSITSPNCETKVLAYTDLSIANSGAVNSWNWNFGDATTSNLQNPTHTYAAAGSYIATLSVTTDKGCTSNPVVSRSVTVNPQPVAGFILPEVCLSDTFAQFGDTSKIASGSITGWLWNFGDPGSGALNTSILQNPQHSYTAVGNYTVTLTVTSNNGCVTTLPQTFVVNGDIPVSNFNALNSATMCANDSVSIQDASTVNFGSVTKVEIYWDNVGAPGVFQTDDFPTTGKIYKHKYPNFQAPLTRTFTIRYRAYSGVTCVNERIKTIVVNAAPKVQFNNIPNACLNATSFQITQASEIGAVPGTGVFSGPGVNATGIFNPASVGAGTYVIKYTFTSAAGGCVDSLSKSITVLDSASARFIFSAQACEKTAITFNSTSSTIPAASGTITGWGWDFGDPASGAANISAAQNPSHLFSSWGTYNVRLFVTTSTGCISTIRTIPVFVNPLPKPNFGTPASACLPSANVTFNNTSTIADGSQGSFTYLWNFGDPASGASNTSTGSSPSHIYNTAGPFNVNLQITSGAGCVHDTTIILNTLHPEPTGSFTIDKTDICVGQSFTFTDNSNPADGTTAQWSWNMADGNTRTIRSFPYTYSTAGTYDVTLFITNNLGCRSSVATRRVTVNPYPTVNAGPDLFILEDGSDTIRPIITAINPTYLWTPNLYFLSSNTIQNPVVKGVLDITYTITVTGQGNCVASDQVFIKVLKGPEIPNIFSPNGDGVHDKWIIKYLDTYPEGTVEVFNRYGQLIFRSVGYNVPWDGTIDGKPVPMGTYYYIVNPKNGRKIMSGYVDVIR